MYVDLAVGSGGRDTCHICRMCIGDNLQFLSTLFAMCIEYDMVRNLVKCWPILLSCLQTNTLKVLVVRSVMRAV
uniref:Uncharacterized protein n=1 Tax=Octopus bimaculoides TaxID=37653 RepID=A0A0L8GB20_OCTBM